MYDLILFDVDGVFLSEERCFDAAALSVWELLYAPHFLSLGAEAYTARPPEETIASVRRLIFQEDQVLHWMKSKGINSNWDMVYLAFSAQLLLILQAEYPTNRERVVSFLQQPITRDTLRNLGKFVSFQPDFAAFPFLFADAGNLVQQDWLTYFNRLAEHWFEIPVSQFRGNGPLWNLAYDVYQEWYLGDRQKGKEGFLQQEVPLIAAANMRQILQHWVDQGIRLGIGTGRRRMETQVPLQTLGLWHLFDPDRIVTASEVIAAEEAYPAHVPLGKPAPFTYVKGILGGTSTDEEALRLQLPIPAGERILIVGDSVADYLAARAIGCHFAAVLTGLTGEAARETFAELGADYIFSDVTEME
jgi:phosphoglycolate phosphatase-like HAD superfamily hydrolase